MEMQGQAIDRLHSEEGPEEGTVPGSCSSGFAIDNATAIVTSSPYTGNLSPSRSGSVEISLQPRIVTVFSQAFPDQFQGVGDKEKIELLPTNCDSSAIINRAYFN